MSFLVEFEFEFRITALKFAENSKGNQWMGIREMLQQREHVVQGGSNNKERIEVR